MPEPLPESDLGDILSFVPTAFAALHRQHIFATGMTGPFGIWILSTMQRLIQTSHISFTVTVLSRNPRRFVQENPHLSDQPWLTFKEGDIRTFSLDGPMPSMVIHGAHTSATETYSQHQPTKSYMNGVLGTQNLLRQLDPSHPIRILFISSGSVYGTTLLPDATLIPEDWPEAPPMTPGSSLGHAKRSAELLCLAHGNEVPKHEIVIARCFSFIGPLLPLNLHYAAGNFLADVLAERPIQVFSSGQACRS